jgi:O-acetylhomoserine (thiol)-lyase
MDYRLDTNCVQAGYTPKSGEPRILPIIQSTTYKYDTSADMAKLFDMECDGYLYTRIANPTNDMVAKKICALEGGSAAMLLASGQAAVFYAIFNIASCGDHIVCGSAIYGGSFNLFSVTMKRMGIDFTFVPPDAGEDELHAAFRPNTKAVYGETIANPALTVLDIELYAKVAHEHGVPLIVDNTFATPVNCRPFEWGADIVVHSTSKYMDGHASVIGGAIVDGGKFNWDDYPDKYPGLTTPDDSYHGVTYTKQFGLGGAYITKATMQLMRDFGSVPSPHSSFLLNLGLESLHVRVPRHCENALSIAQYLKAHDKVAWVKYCSLPGDAYYALAQKYLPNGSCGVVSFGLKGGKISGGGRSAAEAFMKELRLAAIVTHVADARTSVLHPASATHRQMTDAQLAAAGVSPDLVRLSVGIEDIRDIIADLENAFQTLR